MKNILLRLFALFLFLGIVTQTTLAQTKEQILLEGVYQGSNIFVQNPHDGQGNYCVTSVEVNGQRKLVPKSTAFDIDLSNLKKGETVRLLIAHNKDCKPKVLNPHALKAAPGFEFVTVSVTKESIIWSVKGEVNLGRYFVEVRRQGAWEVAATLSGKGKTNLTSYMAKVAHKSGDNEYRIKFLSLAGKVIYSESKNYLSKEEVITFFPQRVSGKLSFSAQTDYAIMDMNGQTLKKGRGTSVDCSDLKTGMYQVRFEGKTDKFFKK